eukprot:25188-Rhodomonas_salina.1
MVANEATLNFKDKSVSFAHLGLQLTIFPVNPLRPADLVFDHTWAEQSQPPASVSVISGGERHPRINPSSGPLQHQET